MNPFKCIVLTLISIPGPQQHKKERKTKPSIIINLNNNIANWKQDKKINTKTKREKRASKKDKERRTKIPNREKKKRPIEYKAKNKEYAKNSERATETKNWKESKPGE